MAALNGHKTIFGSSADAGVALKIGKLTAAGSHDDDYYDSVTSEVSKTNGYSKEYTSSDLTQSAIAEGESVTGTCAGGKTGAGEVFIVLYIQRT